jgi:hypothetical protein
MLISWLNSVAGAFSAAGGYLWTLANGKAASGTSGCVSPESRKRVEALMDPVIEVTAQTHVDTIDLVVAKREAPETTPRIYTERDYDACIEAGLDIKKMNDAIYHYENRPRFMLKDLPSNLRKANELQRLRDRARRDELSMLPSPAPRTSTLALEGPVIDVHPWEPSQLSVPQLSVPQLNAEAAHLNTLTAELRARPSVLDLRVSNVVVQNFSPTHSSRGSEEVIDTRLASVPGRGHLSEADYDRLRAMRIPRSTCSSDSSGEITAPSMVIRARPAFTNEDQEILITMTADQVFNEVWAK